MADLPSSLAGNAAGRSRISTEDLKEHQRERVVDASISVFVEKGYNAATVDDIVSAAKVGVGNFYDLLGGKDECFGAALDQGISIIRDELDWDSEVPGGIAARLHELLKALDANAEAARLVLVEARRADRKSRERYDELAAEIAGVLRSKRSSSSSYPEHLEFGLVAGAGTAIAQTLEKGGGVESLFEPIGRFCLAPYLGAKELERVIGKRRS